MDYYKKYKKYLRKYERLKSLFGGADYSKILDYDIYAIELPKSYWFPKDVKKLIKDEKMLEIKDWDERTRSLIWAYNQHLPTIRSDFSEPVYKIDRSHIPKGLYLYKIYNIDISDVKKELNSLYNEGPKRDIFFSRTSKGTTGVKLDNETSEFNAKYKSYLINSLNFLREKKFDKLAKYIEKYAEIICKIINYDYEKYVNECDFHILKYDSEIGIRWHFDNITRNRNYEITTINIGNGPIYYDMAPVYTKAYNKPVRVKIENGDMVIMSEDSRYLWTHGIPNNIPNYAGKFSILFKR
jgi:hypothetical protein